MMHLTTTHGSLWRATQASYAFVERNFNMTKRYWGWEVVWLTYSVANALAITYIGAGMEQISGVAVDTSYLVLYLLIGSLVWGYLSMVFHSISETVAWERWEGTIEYTFMAPISRITHMLGQTAYSVLYGLLFSCVVFGFVAIFFRLDLGQANLLGALAALASGSVSFIGMGIVAAVLPLLYPERGAQMTHVMEALLLLVSGVYYPVTVLPTWMQSVARLSPATYALESMRAALLDNASWGQLLPNMLLMVAMGMATIPIGVWVFSRAEHYAKRTGRLKRTG